ncbi:MAG: YIP1 family protein [Colwellia sp.]|nr:YIP1 family protein [Colwellia sp.]
MVLNHIWGLYTHPKDEWQTIEKQHESLVYSLMHILIIALIPTICGYYSTAYIGWTIGVGDPITISQNSAQVLSAVLYVTLITAILSLAYLIKWMAKTFDSKPSFIQSLELAAYTATPMLMVGITTLYPVLWFVALSGLIAVSYSIYLLYSGVPIMMNIPEEKGFIYSSSVVTCGLVLLVGIMVLSIIMWGMGFGPEYVN